MAGSAYRGWQGGLLGGGTDLSLLEFKVRMVASMNQFGKLYLTPPTVSPRTGANALWSFCPQRSMQTFGVHTYATI